MSSRRGRPVRDELAERLAIVRTRLESRTLLFTRGAARDDCRALDWHTPDDISEGIGAVLDEVQIEHYCGERPPVTANDPECRGAELFPFAWDSVSFGCRMVLQSSNQCEGNGVDREPAPLYFGLGAAMECPMCDGTLRETTIAQDEEFKGVKLHVRVPGMRCDSCGYESINVTQVAEYNRRVADAYRKHEGLLTSAEVRAARERLEMSQQEFADYIGVGVASVKRWEWGQVQERSMDKLLRFLTDPDEAERVARRVRKLVSPNTEVVAAPVHVDTTAAMWQALVSVAGSRTPAAFQFHDAWKCHKEATTGLVTLLQPIGRSLPQSRPEWVDDDRALDQLTGRMVS